MATDFLDAIRYWRKLLGDERAHGALAYGGDSSFARERTAVWSWRHL
jgi:hypothetical protein